MFETCISWNASYNPIISSMTTNFKTIFIVFRFEHSFFTNIYIYIFKEHVIFLLMFHPLLQLHETI
jgi:hypothetical protein